MAGEEDLVSQVRIEGIAQTQAQLDGLGKSGEAAFNKIGDAAARSGRGINNSYTAAVAAINQLKNLQPAAGAIGSIEQLTGAFGRLQRGIGQAERSFNPFLERTRRLTRVSAVVTGGLLLLARTVSKSYDDAGKATETFADKQIRALQASHQAETAQFSFQQSVAGLRRSLNDGSLTFEQYNERLQDLRRSYRDQQAAARLAADQADELRETTQRLQAQAAKTKAFDDLTQKFGGPLTQSLIIAGRAVGVFMGDIQTALGPAIARAVDRVVALFETNRQTIIAFFDSIAKRIDAFVSDGGVERAFEGIGAILSAIGGLITKVIIPVVQELITVFGAAAKVVNALFGTELTGGVLLAITALGLFTRAFGLAFGIIRIGIGVIGIFGGVLARVAAIIIGLPQIIGFVTIAVRIFIAALGPVGLAITVISLALLALQTSGVDVMGMLRTFIAFLGTIPAIIRDAFNSAGQWIRDAFNGAIEWVRAKFNEFIGWVQSIPGQLGAIFTAAGAAIVQAFDNSINAVQAKFAELLAAARRYIQPVIDMLKVLASLLGGTGEGVAAAGGGQFAGGGGVNGPGTGTSDSIPAWLSNGEFVIRARAVRQYGRAFMEAVNAGRFNLGGYVSAMTDGPRPRVRYADGGAVGGGGAMRPINLNLPGESFQVQATEQEAQKVIRYAVKKQTRQAGRKPTWMR